MANKKEFKVWIEKQVKYYKPYLDINLQNIVVKNDNKVDYLQISCTYPYLEPCLKFSDEAVESWKDGDLPKERILHELIHILTDPLYYKAIGRYVGKDEIENERERLTDKITVILNNLIG